MTLTKRNLISTFFRSYPLLLAGTFLSGTLNSLLSLAIPISFGKYYQLAFHTHSPRGRVLDSLIKLHHLHQFFLFFGILIVLKGLFTFLEKYLTGYSSEQFSKDLRERLFSTQLFFFVSAYDKKPAGKFLLRYSGDLSAIQRYIMKGVLQFTIDVIFLVMAFSLLMVMNYQMTLLAFGVCLAGLILLYALNRILQRLTVKRRNIRSEMLSFVSSRLHGILTVKAFNREPLEEGKYTSNSDKLFRFGKRYFKWYGMVSALIPVLLYSAMAGVFYFSHQQRVLDRSHFPAHELLIFIMVLLSVLPYLRRLLAVTLVWQAGNVSISKVLRIVNSPAEERHGNEKERFELGRISLRDLEFTHTNGRKVFNGFSADFPEHSISRICGPQGSGKSTLFKLLLGLYAPEKGSIIVDNNHLNPSEIYRFRRNITIVSDEFPLLGKSVFEAVSYSRKVEKREKTFSVLKELGFAIGTDDNALLDFPIAVAGSNLSLGQRKQLLMARALLTRKIILLLDEPFHGMDDVAKQKAVMVLNRLKKKRTIIIIASDCPEQLEVDSVKTLSVL